MFRNYWKTAIRHLRHHRSFTFITVSGLAIGVLVSLVIFRVIRFHSQFDDFHTKHHRIYRVLTDRPSAGGADAQRLKEVPFPLPKALATAFPQVEEVAPVFASHDDILILPDSLGRPLRQFKEEKGLFFTSPAFFRMFDFPLLEGSLESLKEPNSVFLTRTIAEKYFGDWKTAMGKTLHLELGGYLFEHGTDVLKVTGILQDIPELSDFPLKLVVAYGTGATGSIMEQNTNWQDRTNTGFGCFVLLPEGQTASAVSSLMAQYVAQQQSPDNNDRPVLQSLRDMHFDTQAGNYGDTAVSRELLTVLKWVAVFILLIACVNFINLSTAQGVNRAREVGVRKVLGSNRSQLQRQFLLEAFLLTGASVLLATAAAALVWPYLKSVLKLPEALNGVFIPETGLFLVGLTVAVALLAGFYPSLVLSRFSPATALKSKFIVNGNRGISLRRALVVFQFVIAQVLIIGTLVIVEQMDFFRTQPLGFDKQAIVTVPFRVDSLRISRLNSLKDQLKNVGGVRSVSFSSNSAAEEANDTWSSFHFNRSAKEAGFKAITRFVDPDFLSVHQLSLVAGRNLKPSAFTQEFLVNESFVRSLGYSDPAQVLNKTVSIWNGQIQCNIVGVVKDFKNRSLRDGLAPMLMSTNVTMYNQAAIKLETSDLSLALQQIRKVWESSFPAFVFDYRFLDEKVNSFYRQEEQMARLYQWFAVISIFLSALGLYGLASFMALQRMKEVGIRKLLGASSSSIAVLFSSEFVGLVLLAFGIAGPLALYFSRQWLNDYAYRIPLSGWFFAAGGALALLIALATVSLQTLRTASLKPVKSLKAD